MAFRAGNTSRAYGLLQAYALQSADDEAAIVLRDYRWAKHRSKPQLGVNVAVALNLKNSGSLTDLRPVGTDLSGIQGNGAGGGRGGPSMGGGRPGFGGAAGGIRGGGGNSSKPGLTALAQAKELSDAAGTLATRFIKEFDELHSDGVWTEAFRDYGLGVPSSGGGGGSFAGGTFGGGPGAAGNNGPPAGYSGGTSGPPAGYTGGGGPPAGYTGGKSGPPAGYTGGASGPPAGYTGGASGPPAGYSGGASGPPAGYSGGASGPPAGYSGGGMGSAPGGKPGMGSAPGGKPSAGSNGSAPANAPAGTGAGSSSGSASDASLPFLGPQGFDDAAPPSGGGPGAGGFGAGNQPQPPVPVSNIPSTIDTELPSGIIPLAPCLSFIGTEESANDLIKRANKQGFDSLILFEVEVKANARGIVNNDARIRLIDLKDLKSARNYNGKKLNNIQVAREAKGEDSVESSVNMVIKKAREHFALQEMPAALSAEIVKTKRLPALVKDKDRSKLDLLSEVNLYFSMGLIDAAEKQDAFEGILGADGRTLATGTEDERKEILDRLVRRELE
jgi:hypothetical protein